MKNNNFLYKWKKLFASKRYSTEDGVIKLTPLEQQELLDDSEKEFKRIVNEMQEKALKLVEELNNEVSGK